MVLMTDIFPMEKYPHQDDTLNMDSSDRWNARQAMVLMTDIFPMEKYPHQDSNLELRIRNPLLYPFNYGGINGESVV